MNFSDLGLGSPGRLIKVDMPTVPLQLDEEENEEIFGKYYSRQITHLTNSSFLSVTESSDTEVEVFFHKGENLPETTHNFNRIN